VGAVINSRDFWISFFAISSTYDVRHWFEYTSRIDFLHKETPEVFLH
jgi:hypothetical protein